MSDEKSGVSRDRLLELKLYDAIMRKEKENMRTKKFDSKKMESEIKNLIQTSVKIEEN